MPRCTKTNGKFALSATRKGRRYPCLEKADFFASYYRLKAELPQRAKTALLPNPDHKYSRRAAKQYCVANRFFSIFLKGLKRHGNIMGLRMYYNAFAV